ncbi:MAG: AraC family transcriptional regulator [Ectothiorhodospiraceae bacterium]|nr:AraC family transcriptional regulator [Ectothiorhodospiraceae bacterium]
MPINIDFTPYQGHVEQNNAYLTFLPSPPLCHWVQSFWQLNVPSGEYCYRSMPDNCVDVIVNVDYPEDIFIITPFSTSIVFDFVGPISYFGIRFRVLGHGGLISVPLGEWSDDEAIKVSDLLPNHILHAIYEGIGKSLHFSTRCKNLMVILLSLMRQPTIDSRLARYIRFCHTNTNSRINISDKQCADFGLSSRQLRRLSQLYLGLSPRELARVFRFQRMLQSMNTSTNKTTWADYYYDQSHFICEFKKLSGLTPNQFKSLSVLYNNN